MSARAAGRLLLDVVRFARPREKGPDTESASVAHQPGEPGVTMIQDALTGLTSLTSLEKDLRTALIGGRSHDRQVAVLALELAGLEAITRAYGHAAGDLLLRHAAMRLLASLRDRETVARTGPRTFAIVQTGIRDAGAATALCRRLTDVLQEPYDLAGRPGVIGVQIGCALAPSDGSAPEVLLERAAAALERARLDGPWSVRFFDQQLDAELRLREALARDLHDAFGEGRLDLRFEPQIDLATRCVAGLSCHVRWRHPVHGPIAEDDLRAVADETALSIPIGAWLLRAACGLARRWHHAGFGGLQIVVGLSPVQLRQQDLPGQVARTVQDSGLDPAQVALEVGAWCLTEPGRAAAVLQALRTRGFRIVLAGLGAGPVSFDDLRDFVADGLKLDPSITAACPSDRSAAAIARAVQQFGQALGLQTIAAGIETADQLQLLVKEGWSHAKGSYFGPPLTATEAEALLGGGHVNYDVWEESPLHSVG